MHIVVFGTGGVGGYFGGRLAQAGESVTFIARGEHLHAMRTNGLQVNSIKGDFSIRPVSVTDDTRQVRDVDAVLVCVKTWQIPAAANAIKPMLGPSTVVVPLGNGVENAAQLAEVLGDEHVADGMCRIASRIAAPGVIQHSVIEPYVAFSELDNHPSERTERLLQAFLHAGVKAEIPVDIRAAVWNKFLFISAGSGMGAVTRVPFDAFRSIDGTRQLLIEALRECQAVAVAQGVDLPLDSIDATLAFIDALPPGTTASMQRDIMAGRPSELEAHNGAIVRLGRKLNIPTPVHALIYYSLLPQETLARKSAGQ